MTNTLTIEQYDAIESELREMKTRLDAMFTLAWDNEAFRLGRDIVDIQQSLGSLAYMSHPQQEWLGGDSSDPKNFTRRLPHIHNLV